MATITKNEARIGEDDLYVLNVSDSTISMVTDSDIRKDTEKIGSLQLESNVTNCFKLQTKEMKESDGFRNAIEFGFIKPNIKKSDLANEIEKAKKDPVLTHLTSTKIETDKAGKMTIKHTLLGEEEVSNTFGILDGEIPYSITEWTEGIPGDEAVERWTENGRKDTKGRRRK